MAQCVAHFPSTRFRGLSIDIPRRLALEPFPFDSWPTRPPNHQFRWYQRLSLTLRCRRGKTDARQDGDVGRERDGVRSRKEYLAWREHPPADHADSPIQFRAAAVSFLDSPHFRLRN